MTATMAYHNLTATGIRAAFRHRKRHKRHHRQRRCRHHITNRHHLRRSPSPQKPVFSSSVVLDANPPRTLWSPSLVTMPPSSPQFLNLLHGHQLDHPTMPCVDDAPQMTTSSQPSPPPHPIRWLLDEEAWQPSSPQQRSRRHHHCKPAPPQRSPSPQKPAVPPPLRRPTLNH